MPTIPYAPIIEGSLPGFIGRSPHIPFKNHPAIGDHHDYSMCYIMKNLH
jgi:hypothetical protein